MQNKSLTPVNNFVKGLITEAGIMTFPEGASIDELNCTLERTEVRSRRRGFAQEVGGGLSSYTKPDNASIAHREIWKDVGGVANLDFLVAQIGSTLHFYDLSRVPISAGYKSFTVNLNTFSANNQFVVSRERIQLSGIQGIAVITHPGCNTFYIEYNADTDSITTGVINFEVRDFDWQCNCSAYYAEITNPTLGRTYDTYNTGWTADLVLAYQGGSVPSNVSAGNTEDASKVATTLGPDKKYPALTHAWFSGKDSNDNFSLSAWRKVAVQTGLIGNGRFILNFFNKDRKAKVGVNLPNEVETARFRTCVGFAGRMFYAGLDSNKNGGRILFTQIVQNSRDLGKCHQAADPTSEIDPDLADNDGGVILIPEARNIKRLFVYNSFLIVFAQNGVWTINGVDGVFKATEYSVSKRSEVGLDSEASLVSADGNPLWWSLEGIHTMQPSQDGFNLQEQNISLGTIQTFFDNISRTAKAGTTCAFDRTNKIVLWAYPNDDETIGGKVNNFLLLDLSLQAFYPWKVLDNNPDTSYIMLPFYTNGAGVERVDTQVTLNGIDVTSNGEDVTTTLILPNEATQPGFTFMYKDGGTDNVGFGQFYSRNFLDFGNVDYTSFAEAGYNFQGSVNLRGNAPYITTILQKTETSFVNNDYDFPSSCLMSVYWDERIAPATNRVQIYRLRFPAVPPNFNYPYSAIITKNKVIGRGRLMRIRFDSETGKDFQLVGYEVMNSVNRA
jgi:hypothetical protein